jgi:hypothetical protein
LIPPSTAALAVPIEWNILGCRWIQSPGETSTLLTTRATVVQVARVPQGAFSRCLLLT